MSTWSGISTALSALRTQRVAIEVAGQNIANVNTPGYARQRVDMTGHDICTDRLRRRQQPSISRGAKAAGAAMVGTAWTGSAWAEDPGWAAAIQPPWDWDNEGSEMAGLFMFTERALWMARAGRRVGMPLATGSTSSGRFALVGLCDCQEPVKQVREAFPGNEGAYWHTLACILRNIKALRGLGVDT